MSKWQVFKIYLVHGARTRAEMAKGGFRLACLALQNAKTEHMEMKITQPIFGILVALTKKRTYQNDMKSTIN